MFSQNCSAFLEECNIWEIYFVLLIQEMLTTDIHFLQDLSVIFPTTCGELNESKSK